MTFEEQPEAIDNEFIDVTGRTAILRNIKWKTEAEDDDGEEMVVVRMPDIEKGGA
jgi:hypothetical protein